MFHNDTLACGGGGVCARLRGALSYSHIIREIDKNTNCTNCQHVCLLFTTIEVIDVMFRGMVN